MITATAPGCCALAGDPTDLYGGSVLACATQERTRCTLTPGGDGIILSASGEAPVTVTPSDLVSSASDPLNVARAVLTALEVVPGETPPFRLTTETDIPPAAGLGGRAALLAAVTGCVLAHLELRLGPYEVAELIRKIDADILGTVCGFQDQYMAVFGGLHFLDFRDKDSRRPQEPPSPFAVAESLGQFTEDLPLILAYAPRSRPSRVAACEMPEPVATELARLARRSKRALLAAHWDVLAAFMDNHRAILPDLSGVEEDTEALIAAALDGGTSGAKVAGGDGSAILALTTDRARTVQALQDAGAVLLHDPLPSPGLVVSVEVTV